ncbi:MAG: EamA family transporter, partial [Chitinophagaceae bacterium]
MDSGQHQSGKGIKLFLAGIVFSILWPSASTASKIALEYAQPFVISIVRFLVAGVIMLIIVHFVMRKRMPAGVEWKQLCIYGLLNITLYLSLYIIAMQNVSAGLGSLSIATNPVFISLISAAVLRKPLKQKVVFSLALCITGVLIAAWPLFATAHATPLGLSLLILSMVLYSAGVIYFSEKNWNGLHILAINGWQTLIGGLFVLPLVFLTYDGTKNHLETGFFVATLWLCGVLMART